ncbi:MAG: hypothetical protein BGO41_01450 [Clostridiales bacterium 38-18]|nr:MAG: hypothetical protein BGO41_01450 [Clostridiales bacterium 38-18]
MYNYLVATLHLENDPRSLYVKVTLKKSATQIANFLLSCENVKLIRFFTWNQNDLLFEFHDENFYFANNSTSEIESIFLKAVINYHEKKVEMIPNDNEVVRIFNFWFSDDFNNLETFRRTIEYYGLDIHTFNWGEGSIYQE